MTWIVEFEDVFEQEFLGFKQEVCEAILAAARLLEDCGPQLGLPHADTLEGSCYANMKEFRFVAADGIRSKRAFRCHITGYHERAMGAFTARRRHGGIP
jgi:hypothetical protein